MENRNELQSIQEAIASAGHSWTAGSTFLTTLQDDERKKYLGYAPGPAEQSLEQRESSAAANFAAFKSSAPMAGAVSASASIDWRNVSGQNYVTPIKNQGGCGSCVAFGVTAAVESKIKLVRGAGYPIDLSEAQLFYCIARSQGRMCGGASGGWWPEPAMIGYRDIGITDEACYPYVAGDQNCTGLCSDWASRVTKITGYTKLNTIAAMKDWISTNGPVETCFTVYNDFFSYTSGVYKKANDTVAGGHCVCVIGYDDAQQCWICKNQWGAGWGEAGFFKIGYGQCGIDAEMIAPNGIIDNYWINGKKVVGLYASNNDRNGWVYLSDIGWRKISNNNDDGFINIFTQLAAAKAVNATVNVYLEASMITTVYVF